MKLLFTIYLLFSTLLLANAQIFVKHDATGNNDGTSWTNAFTNLQDALDAAIPGDQIWLAAGTYVPDGPTPDSSHFQMLTSVEIYGGFAGTENNLTQRDFEANTTILSGDKNGDDVPGDFLANRADNAHHVLIINAGSSEPIVDGLLFISGSTRLDSPVQDSSDLLGVDRWSGGALYIRNSSAIVKNCTFRDNNGFRGSGIYARVYGPVTNPLVIENSNFEFNNNQQGGACSLRDWNLSYIKQCTFTQNHCNNFGGGLVLGNVKAIIEDCVFDQNSTNGIGGGCFIFNNSFTLFSNPSADFMRCHFAENTAGNSGGALRLNNFNFGFTLNIDSCTFTQNAALSSFSEGGAILVHESADADVDDPTSKVRIDNSTFTGNTSGYGGGVEINALDDSLRIEIQNSVFSNNQVNEGGGGLAFWIVNSAVVDAQIKNNTFDGNTAKHGGGIIFDNYFNNIPLTYVIDSCIFNNNSAEQYGGAIDVTVYELPGPHGAIHNSQFTKNEGLGGGGALDSYLGTLLIENCLFSENYTQGMLSPVYNGGGALMLAFPEEAVVRNSFFENNISDQEASAVLVNGGGDTRFENVLFHGNQGNSTVSNGGRIYLVNATMADNDSGLLLVDNSYSEIQNSIFNNTSANLRTSGLTEIDSKGGNISNDGSMSSVLMGFGEYEDLHNTDPLLGPDFVPLAGSPAIDAGNPAGNTSLIDLAGNLRVQGSSIDIGAYETFTVATENAIWNTQSLTVFPNPAKESLNFQLETDWTGEFQILMYNYSGQQLLQAELFKTGSTQSFQFNINNHPPGEYVLIAKAGTKTYASNIIIGK